MIVLLTFLGTGNYTSACYQFGDQTISHQEAYFSAALASHLKPDRIISLQTEAASKKHGVPLNSRFLDLDFAHVPVKIHEGKAESELWEIFSSLTNSVPRDCTLHLDITHGFRSLPILGFIALNYLRTTRNVTLGGIHYGAWDAMETGVAPAFDITPFLTLLDWTAAADQFLSTGSATRLAGLLGNIQQSIRRNPGEIPTGDLPTKLISLGSTLEIAANNLTLLRTGAIKASAESVARQIENATKSKDITRFAPAFLDVLQPVQADLTRFAGTDLSILRDLIGWLIEKDRPDTALTLAAEWIVSWLMVRLGNSDHHTNEKNRKPYDQCLNLLIDEYSKRNEIPNPSAESKDLLKKLKSRSAPAERECLAAVASQLKTARNDLNHAGFRDSPMAARAIHSVAMEIRDELMQLKLH